MIPILYHSTETEFETNGIGRLTDAILCVVTEERNGTYELEMEYPITGAHFDDIREGRIIAVTHDDNGDIQPFDIYKRSATIDGVVRFYAHHVSYRLGLQVVMPFTATSCSQALNRIKINALGDCPFTFWTDKSVSAEFAQTTPEVIRGVLGGQEGSILDIYGTGEYEFDKFAVKLHLHRGSEKPVTIRYGKDLTELTQELDYSSSYSSVVPFWKSGENNNVVIGGIVTGSAVEADEGPWWTDMAHNVMQFNEFEDFVLVGEVPGGIAKIDWSPWWYDGTRDALLATEGEELWLGASSVPTTVMDLSEQYVERPTVAQLTNKAAATVRTKKPWLPTENIEVDFVRLYNSPEYEEYAPLQTVNLCDTVTIYHPGMNLTATAKIIQTDYNVLLDRYDKVTLGDPRTSFADILHAQVDTQITTRAASKSYASKVAKEQAELLAGGMGGYVVIGRDVDGHPEEILIMNTDSKLTATYVLRINNYGIAFSVNGYNGPYTTAWTIDGSFSANFIRTGSVNADLIQTGTLSVDRIASHSLGLIKLSGAITGGLNDSWKLDLDNGTLTIGNLNASSITAGYLNANRIAGHSLSVGKITGELTGGISNSWGINFETGELTIGNISAGKITTGTLSADRIAGNSISVAKLTGTISGGSDSSWSINLNSGTMTIGNISAEKITSGYLSANRIRTGKITNVIGSDYPDTYGYFNIDNAQFCVVKNSDFYGRATKLYSGSLWFYTTNGYETESNWTVTGFIGQTSAESNRMVVSGTDGITFGIQHGDNTFTHKARLHPDAFMLDVPLVFRKYAAQADYDAIEEAPQIALATMSNTYGTKDCLWMKNTDRLIVDYESLPYIDDPVYKDDHVSFFCYGIYAVGRINAQTFHTRSDERLKSIRAWDSRYDSLIDRITPIQYKPDDRRDTRAENAERTDHDVHIGFGAQSVEREIKRLGIEESSLVKQSAGGEYSINYIEFIPLLVKKVQDQQKQIDRQSAQIDALTARLEALERRMQ